MTLARNCATPDCTHRAGWGTFATMCKRHALELARIRAEYEEEARNSCRSTMNGGKKRQAQFSTCCTVGCMEPRRPPAAYCVVCQAMGAVEDVAA